MSAIPQHIRTVLDLAEEKLKAAQVLLDSGLWRDAASRAYYCAFHAVSAVLLSKGLAFSTHG